MPFFPDKNKKNFSYFIKGITGLRGVSALLIFAIHISSVFIYSNDYLYKFLQMSQYFVVLFFLFSSLTNGISYLTNNHFSYIEYIKKKYVRLAIPYYAILLLAILTIIIPHKSIVLSKFLGDLLLHVSFLNLNHISFESQVSILAVEWTMPIIFWLSLVVPLILYVVLRNRIALYLLLFITISLYFLEKQILPQISYSFGRWTLMANGFIYILGICLLFSKILLNQLRFNKKVKPLSVYETFFIAFIIVFSLFLNKIGSSERLYGCILIGVFIYISLLKNIILKFCKRIYFRIVPIVENFDLLIILFILYRYIKLFYYLTDPVFIIALWGFVLSISVFSGSLLSRFLFENPIIMFIGKISYSFYLLHYVVLNYFNYNFVSIAAWPRAILVFITTIFLSSLSYIFLEKKAYNLFIGKSHS